MTHQAKHADGQRREIPRGSDILVDLHGQGRASDKRRTIIPEESNLKENTRIAENKVFGKDTTNLVLLKMK